MTHFILPLNEFLTLPMAAIWPDSDSPLAALTTPALFYAGLGAISVPILIHLLNRRRFRRVAWAATSFLQEAVRQNRRRVRLEEFILLALRCLAVFLIGLLVAKWFIEPTGWLANLASSGRTQHIIILDDSLSTQLQLTDSEIEARGDQPRSVFERGHTAANELIQLLRPHNGSDSLTILLASRPDRPLFHTSKIGEMDVNALQQELDAAPAEFVAAEMSTALVAAVDQIQASDPTSLARLYVISDFRGVDWRSASPDARVSDSPSQPEPENVLAALQQLSADRAVEVLLIDVGVDAPINRAVSAIEPRQTPVVAGVPTPCDVRVMNYGQAPSPATSLRVFVGDAAQPAVSVPAIEPGESLTVPIEVTFPHEGAEALVIELEPDPLKADDVRRVAVRVQPAVQVLVVNGEASPDPYDDEVFLLTAALRPEGPQFSGNEVVVIDEDEAEAVDLERFHVVVLANVFQLTEEFVSRLESFVQDGGGVLCFLGDQVDPDVYNRMLHRQGRGLLPVQLDESVSVSSDRVGVPLVEPNVHHPALRRLAESRGNFFEGILAWRYFTFTDEVIDWDPDPAMAGGTTPPNGDTPVDQPSRQVLLRFGDGDESPAMVEGFFGDGRVMVLATTADKEWTNLPDRPIYVVLLMELVQHLARSDDRGEHLVGRAIQIPLDPSRYEPTARMKPPSFPAEPIVELNAPPDETTGQPTVRWENPRRPGVYTFELTRNAGSLETRLMAVNTDLRESDLRPAREQDILDQFGDVPARFTPVQELLTATDQQAQREMWPSILVLLVLVLMTEQVFAWWLGTDRNWRSILPRRARTRTV